MTNVLAQNKCSVRINEIEYTIKYYGSSPSLNTKYPVFIPYNKMPLAFIVTGSSSGGGDTSDGMLWLPTVSEDGIISWQRSSTETAPVSRNIKGEQGEQGIQGEKGETGANGTTFTPSVSSAGIISWTNNGGLENPESINLVEAVTEPLDTKLYQNLICSTNSQALGTFYFMGVVPSDYYTPWRIKVRIRAYINENYASSSNASLYYTDTIMELCGSQNVIRWYRNINSIANTSYRPIYYGAAYLLTQTGFSAGLGHAIGFSIYNSTNPTNTSYYRDVKVDLLDYDTCTPTMWDDVVLQASLPSYSTTNYSAITNTDCYNYGTKMTGDNNTIDQLRETSFMGLSGGVYGTQLVLSPDGITYYSITTTRGTGTSKTCTTQAFNPNFIYYYNSSTTITSGNRCASNTFYKALTMDFRYSFNASTLTAYRPVYLKCTRDSSTGLYTLVSSGWHTQTAPTEEDGYYYIFIGLTYSTTGLTLSPIHPVYKYYNGAFRQVVEQYQTYIVDTAPTSSSNDGIYFVVS